MPSIASHFVVSKLVGEKLNIKSDEFYKGNILPDIVDIDNSHLKIKGSYYEIPNIEYFVNNYDLDNELNLGYLCHLLLDRYFLEEYVLENVCYKDIDPFLSGKMYRDYSSINYKLVKYFDLDLEYINDIMKAIDVSVNMDKFKSNLNNINSKFINDELECLDLSSYISFLKDVAVKISNDLMLLGSDIL